MKNVVTWILRVLLVLDETLYKGIKRLPKYEYYRAIKDCDIHFIQSTTFKLLHVCFNTKNKTNKTHTHTHKTKKPKINKNKKQNKNKINKHPHSYPSPPKNNQKQQKTKTKTK